MQEKISNSFPIRRPKQVFTAHANSYVSIMYVLEIYEHCAMIKNKKERYSMYSMHGMDGRNVELYLDEVMKLERVYKTSYIKQ